MRKRGSKCQHKLSWTLCLINSARWCHREPFTQTLSETKMGPNLFLRMSFGHVQKKPSGLDQFATFFQTGNAWWLTFFCLELFQAHNNKHGASTRAKINKSSKCQTARRPKFGIHHTKERPRTTDIDTKLMSGCDLKDGSIQKWQNTTTTNHPLR